MASLIWCFLFTPLKNFNTQAANISPLKTVKRAGAQRISKDFMPEEASSAEKVVEAEQVEEKPKLYHKKEQEIVSESFKSFPQEEILSQRKEPVEISVLSSDMSVTDGLKTVGLKTRVPPKSKEMTRSESLRTKVQGEPSKEKCQEEEFSAQKTESPTANTDIKYFQNDAKECKDVSQEKIERKFEIPEISVQTHSDQKQVVESQHVIFKRDAEDKESIITQVLKDEPKLSVRKPESGGKALEKVSLQSKTKQDDQELKPLKAENIKTTPETQEIDFSELDKQTEKKSFKHRIVKSREEEEELYVSPKSSRQTTLAKEPVRPKKDSQSSQLRDSQFKDSEVSETEGKLMEIVSHKDENIEMQSTTSKDISRKEKQMDKVHFLKKKSETKPELQELTLEKDMTDRGLLKVDAPEKIIQTKECVGEDVRLPDKLEKPKTVYKKKKQPLKVIEQTFEERQDKEYDNFQCRTDAEKHQEMKPEHGSIEVKGSKENSAFEKLPKSTGKLLPESMLSKVVTLEDKWVSPKEGSTEMKPDRETSIEVKHPESMSERESKTDNTLQNPDMLSKGKTQNNVTQKVKQQIVAGDEDQLSVTVGEDKHIQIYPKEKKKSRQEQTKKQSVVNSVPMQTMVEHYAPEQRLFAAEDDGSEEKAFEIEDIHQTKPIYLKEKEHIQTESVTAEDKQHIVPLTHIKSLVEQDISQEITDEEKSFEKSRPATKVSKADIDWHEPTAREPSVTNKTQTKLTEREPASSNQKTDSSENGDSATTKWKPEVRQSFLKKDVQHIPSQEVRTRSRKEEDAQGLQSISHTRVFSLEPEGKEPQELIRGIEGKMLYVTSMCL